MMSVDHSCIIQCSAGTEWFHNALYDYYTVKQL